MTFLMTPEMESAICTFGFWFEDSKDREDWAETDTEIVSLQPFELDDDWEEIDGNDFKVIVLEE